MNRRILWLLLSFALIFCPPPMALEMDLPLLEKRARGGERTGTPPAETTGPTTVAQARARARILHETIHGALQVMHRDLFREDEKLTIPSQSLEDVFKELHRSHDVEARWLAVNTEAMNVDHRAQTDFEKDAVKALATGETEFESTDDRIYRYAGAIRLSSQCLKCHLPNRTSTEDRAAGLVISIPLSKQKRETQ